MAGVVERKIDDPVDELDSVGPGKEPGVEIVYCAAQEGGRMEILNLTFAVGGSAAGIPFGWL